MNILLVHSGNSVSDSSEYSFVKEQGDALEQMGVNIFYFSIKGKGVLGYLSNIMSLRKNIKQNKINIVHAHYGLSGALCVLQKMVPVIVTFHGSDIHSRGAILLISKFAAYFSTFNIFINSQLYKILNYTKENYIIQACGIDLELMKSINKNDAREKLGWNFTEDYVLFAGNFARKIKNAAFAKAAIKQTGREINLIELKGYERFEIPILMSACDCLLLTSFREGSPTVIKEAMACNLPIVTTDVGDAKWVIKETRGCYVAANDIGDCAIKIDQAITFAKTNGRTNGRGRLTDIGLEKKQVANRIYQLYKKIIYNENE